MKNEFSPYELFKALTKNYDKSYNELKSSLDDKQTELFKKFIKAMSELKTFECEDSYRLGRAIGAMSVINSDDKEENEESERYKTLKKIYDEICCKNESGDGNDS